MSTKDDYTPDEWKSITGAPYLAGLFVTMSDPSGVAGITKEALAVAKAISESGSASATEVIKSVADGLKAAGFKAKAELPDLPKGDLAAARAAVVGHLQKAASAISAKSPAEADAYKAWLMTAAKKVAEAAKEGGFLGFGGTAVSDQERAALEDLAKTLGVTL